MSSTNNLSLRSVRPRINIDGSEHTNMGESALALQIHLPRFGMASAELRLLNWGQTRGDQPDFLFNNLRLGSRIEMWLDEGAETPAFSGEITAIEERYGEGAPQLVILAEDLLHRLARQRHNRVFEQQSLDELIGQIASEAGLQADINVSSGNGTWLQANESNLAFLMRLLTPYDVGLRLDNGTLRVRDEESDPEPVALDAASAIKIRIIADLNQQPAQVNVNGYDLQNDEPTRGSGTESSPPPSGQTGAALLDDLGWKGESTLPHPFATTQQEAEKLASRQFRQRANRFLHGEIICQGNSQLKSGREIQLNALSPKLIGRYRVMECWHQFDMENGLRTRLRVQRPDWNQNG